MKRPFRKQPLTLESQIAQLRARGLAIRDEEAAKKFLSQVHYARLRAYWHAWEQDPQNHSFKPGASFEEIIRLYELDRKLRLLVLEALERIEVALRSQWAYHLAHRLGPWAHEDASIHSNPSFHQNDLKELEKEWEKAWKHDPVLKHFQEKYAGSPPIWLACEVMSFGTLSRFFANLRDVSLSRDIAASFGVPHSFLKEAIKHLVVVRNIAAHHGRLWDREISAYTLPYVRKNPRELKEAMERATHPQKLFRTLSLLLFLMKNLGWDGEWRGRLFDVLSQYGPYLEERMGFPPGFRELTLWQGMP